MKKTLNLQEIVKAYLDYNGLTASYMARVTHIADSTLREWLEGRKENMSADKIYRVKEFLKGNFLLSVETIINHLLIEGEKENEND